MGKQYICVAMRGRPIDNPSCRIAGLTTAQRLEVMRGGALPMRFAVGMLQKFLR